MACSGRQQTPCRARPSIHSINAPTATRACRGQGQHRSTDQPGDEGDEAQQRGGSRRWRWRSAGSPLRELGTALQRIDERRGPRPSSRVRATTHSAEQDDARHHQQGQAGGDGHALNDAERDQHREARVICPGKHSPWRLGLLLAGQSCECARHRCRRRSSLRPRGCSRWLEMAECAAEKSMAHAR